MRTTGQVRLSAWLVILAFQFLAVLPTAAVAGISAPNSSATFSKDGRHILVMRSPDAVNDNRPDITFPDGRVAHIRDCFPKSGAYDASTLEPEWEVDWFSLNWDLLWSEDFRHVVRINRLAIRGGWAIAFYDRGKLIRTYDCMTLLSGLRHPLLLPFETWDWHSRWYEHLSVSSSGDRLAVSTARRQIVVVGKFDLGLQEFYEFDLASGAMISKRITGAWVPWVYLAGILVVSLGLYVAISRIVQRLMRLRHRNGREFPVP